MDPIAIILGLVAAFIVGSLIYKFFIKKPSIKIEPEVVSREPVVKDSIRYNTQSNSLRSSSHNHRPAKQDHFSKANDENDLLAAAVVSSFLMSDDDSNSHSTRSYSSDYDSDSRSSYSGSSSSNYSSSSYDSGSSISSSSDSSSSSSGGGSD